MPPNPNPGSDPQPDHGHDDEHRKKFEQDVLGNPAHDHPTPGKSKGVLQDEPYLAVAPAWDEDPNHPGPPGWHKEPDPTEPSGFHWVED